MSINKSLMYAVKVILATAALCSALCGFILLWNEEATSCGITLGKVFETMFFVSSLWLTREATALKVETHE